VRSASTTTLPTAQQSPERITPRRSALCSGQTVIRPQSSSPFRSAPTPCSPGAKAFNVALSGPTGGAGVGNPSSATATIDGGAVAAIGTLGLSASAYTVAQTAGTLQVTVNRTSGSSGAVSVGYSTSNGSAVSGTTYTATSGTLQWGDGDGASKTFTIAISNVTPFNGTESFTVNLSGAAGGASPGTSQATVTVNGSGVTPNSPTQITGNVFWV